MKSLFSILLGTSILFYGLFHFITYFYDNTILIHLLVFFGISFIIFTLLTVNIKKMKMPFSLIIVGIIIFVVSDGNLFEGLYDGILKMRNMIGLLIVVPIISWVLKEEPYIESLISMSNKVLNTSRKFYLGIMSLTQIISFFLLFASIPMMYQFANSILKNEKGEVWENFKGTAILRGFAMTSMWVVSIPSFVFAVEALDASLGLSMLQGLGIATIGTMIAVIFSYFQEKSYKVNLTKELRLEINEVIGKGLQRKRMKQTFIEFIILFLTLFGTIFILSVIIHVELMIIISLVIVGWTISYFILKKRTAKFISEAKEYGSKGITTQAYQLCVMLGAGILITALDQTGFANSVINGINALNNTVPFINILSLLPFIIIILGFLGLGPLTVMVLVGGILQSLHLPYPPEIIVLSITSGSSISVLLSPLIIPIIVLSISNGLSGLKNGIQFNLKYAVVIYIITQIYIQTFVHFS